jgi:hypothetical protein
MFHGADLSQADRNDYGSFRSFSNWQLMQYCNGMHDALVKMRDTPSELPVGVIPVRVRLLMEEVFYPASVPLNYDSKKATGMVGLENLGATCYLNALLQVGRNGVNSMVVMCLQRVFLAFFLKEHAHTLII